MPGILCSAYDPADATVEPKWQRGLELLRHRPEHILEHYNEPGFQLASSGNGPARSKVCHRTLVPGAAAQRLKDLLEDRIRATEQARTLLPSALFIQALEQVLDLSNDHAGAIKASIC